jgi:hypothetical protein
MGKTQRQNPCCLQVYMAGCPVSSAFAVYVARAGLGLIAFLLACNLGAAGR